MPPSETLPVITATHAACGSPLVVVAAAVKKSGMVMIVPAGVGVIIPTGVHLPGTQGVLAECTADGCPDSEWQFVPMNLDMLVDRGPGIDPSTGLPAHVFEVPSPL